VVWHSSKRAPGRRVETGVLSTTNVSANRRSSKYLTTRLSLMCFSWITQWASTRLVAKKKYPGRVALQITYWQSPAAAGGIVARTHVYWSTTSPIFPNLSYRVERKKKKDNTCCQTWIKVEYYWVNSCLTMSCLAEWAVATWGPHPTPICQVAMTEGWLWHAVSLYVCHLKTV